MPHAPPSPAGTPAAVETPACPACDSPQTVTYVSGDRDRVRDIRRPYTFFMCTGCRLRFQSVTPDEARGLFSDVQETAAKARPYARRELRCDDDVVRRLTNAYPAGRRLLDVGSGDGWLLAAGRRAGLDCTGVDVSPALAEVARKNSGATVLVGQLSKLGLPDGSFDFINFEHVLMYVPEPVALIRTAAALLSPGGIIRVREFDPDSLIGRLKGRDYWMYAPTHVSVWGERPLRALAARGGLRVARVLPGTEASLSSWLDTGNARHSLKSRLRDTAAFVFRRAGAFGFRAGADTAYYLKRSVDSDKAGA